MGFNYGLEKRKFTEEWKKLYSEYTVISRPSSQSTSMSWSMAISSRVSSLFSFKFSRSFGQKIGHRCLCDARSGYIGFYIVSVGPASSCSSAATSSNVGRIIRSSKCSPASIPTLARKSTIPISRNIKLALMVVYVTRCIL